MSREKVNRILDALDERLEARYGDEFDNGAPRTSTQTQYQVGPLSFTVRIDCRGDDNLPCDITLYDMQTDERFYRYREGKRGISYDLLVKIIARKVEEARAEEQWRASQQQEVQKWKEAAQKLVDEFGLNTINYGLTSRNRESSTILSLHHTATPQLLPVGKYAVIVEELTDDEAYEVLDFLRDRRLLNKKKINNEET